MIDTSKSIVSTLNLNLFTRNLSLDNALVGLTQLAPVIGVINAERLSKLYGLDFNEPNLQILMRHRVVLLGLLGSFIIYTAFQPQLQLIGIIAAYISILSFIGFIFSVGGYNNHLKKVNFVDIGALVILI